jgi:5-methylcytosine-specific restriction endonuclease McrA
MAFTLKERRRIYDRTYGKCHICGKKLSFTNYSYLGLKGAWEVEHSNPKSMGGTNNLNNLYAACILCNRKKNNKSTRSIRAKNGRSRAPLSKEQRKKVRRDNSILGVMIGGLLGSVAGPPGMLIGATIGAKMGFDKEPDDD